MIRIYRTHDDPLLIDADTLNKINLIGMNFHRCLLNNIDVIKTDLSDCDFRSAEMTDSVFNYSVFNNAKLIMVEAHRSFFEGCLFKDALLFYSSFKGSSFQFANFSEVHLKEVNFEMCDLRGANLNCKGLETCSFDNAIYDEFTVWNHYFDVSKAGAIMKSTVK